MTRLGLDIHYVLSIFNFYLMLNIIFVQQSFEILLLSYFLQAKILQRYLPTSLSISRIVSLSVVWEQSCLTSSVVGRISENVWRTVHVTWGAQACHLDAVLGPSQWGKAEQHSTAG